MDVKFTWDPGKKESNVRKHGVTFEEAAEALSDPLGQTKLDSRHPVEELRFITVGETLGGKLLIVGFADYVEVVQIITARTATKKERRAYEES